MNASTLNIRTNNKNTSPATTNPFKEEKNPILRRRPKNIALKSN
jgi:hypothetical protein